MSTAAHKTVQSAAWYVKLRDTSSYLISGIWFCGKKARQRAVELVELGVERAQLAHDLRARLVHQPLPDQPLLQRLPRVQRVVQLEPGVQRVDRAALLGHVEAVELVVEAVVPQRVQRPLQPVALVAEFLHGGRLLLGPRAAQQQPLGRLQRPARNAVGFRRAPFA